MKKKLVFGALVMAVLFGDKAHARCRVPEIPGEFTPQLQW